MYVVIIFFNESRSDYHIKGPFSSYKNAERGAWDVRKNYNPSGISAVDIAKVLEP